jgi:two-component system phosphate regulon sensor histidine kinase PhoR
MHEVPETGDRPEKADRSTDLEFCRFIIDSLPAAILTVDSELRITGFNPWAEKITGYRRNEVIAKHCGDVLQSKHCGMNCPLRRVLNRERSVIRGETVIRNKSGELVPVRMHTAGVFDDQGHLIGGLEAFVDISYTKALERQRDNFISMFAHDMKSPVIAVHGFANRLLREKAGLDETQTKYMHIIEKEAADLESLIDDFLEFSRLQTGHLKLNLSATSLDKDLYSLYDVYQRRAKEKGLNLELRSPEPLPVIQADPARLNRVFANLLDNAIKFSKESGTITISTHETEREIAVRIQDEGIGMDRSELAYIFDPFHRGHGERQREGYGLGLAAVKAIVEEHGGRVQVSSEPGHGSVFVVFLPKQRRET